MPPGCSRWRFDRRPVLVATDRAAPVLVPLRTMIDVPERRNQGGGARIARTELRADGDVATDRVVVVARSGDGRREYEAADVLTVARREGGWRVAHVVFRACSPVPAMTDRGLPPFVVIVGAARRWRARTAGGQLQALCHHLQVALHRRPGCNCELARG